MLKRRISKRWFISNHSPGNLLLVRPANKLHEYANISRTTQGAYVYSRAHAIAPAALDVYNSKPANKKQVAFVCYNLRDVFWEDISPVLEENTCRGFLLLVPVSCTPDTLFRRGNMCAQLRCESARIYVYRSNPGSVPCARAHVRMPPS